MSNRLQTIQNNIKSVKDEVANVCESCGRNAEEITIVAASKTFTTSDIEYAHNAGITHFGENKVQEARPKIEGLHSLNLSWHYIGSLQTNKARDAVYQFNCVQSVDRANLADALNDAAESENRKLDVLIQVNPTSEETKHGVYPEHYRDLLKTVTGLKHLNLRGIMAIGPNSGDDNVVREAFREVRDLFKETQKEGCIEDNFDILSMGMTGDFKLAIEEGSTMIRIGTAIFGPRQYT